MLSPLIEFSSLRDKYGVENETFRDRVARQIALEDEARALGASRYRSRRPLPWRSEPSSPDEEAELPPGRQLLKLATEPTAAAIAEFTSRIAKGGAGSSPEAHNILSQLGAHEAAYLTGRVVLHSAITGMKLTATAIAVADAFIEHIQMSALRKNRKDVFDGLIKSQQRATSTVSRKKKRAIQNTVEEHGADREFPLKDRVRTGLKAIDLFCDSTGLFVVESGSRGTRYVRPTEAVHKWLEQQHARCEILEPIHLPMIVRPRRWVSPFKGGYITKRPGSRLVKQANAAYHQTLRDVDMPDVYAAVNAVQDTAWRINTAVLEVMREVWDHGGVLGGLPSRDPAPMPPRPYDFAINEKVKARWKREAADIHSANSKSLSKRLAVSQRLWVAHKFSREDAIYFPHELDFRGRIYPIATGGPHPQGDDLAKSLLEFAEGHPITHAGANWLAIHLAGLFGQDKLPFSERVDWVFANEAMILDSARDPLDGQRFWASADSPFMALAACREWLGYVTEGEGFVSHLPVHLDGSNSGLQHFSAMLLDPVGAKAVNLIPDDRPQDVYAEVAAKVQAMADASEAEHALAWQAGKVTRKIAKRPVMTFCYSATRFGMTDMVYQTLRELDTDSAPHLGDADNYAASLYLSYALWDAISDTVVAASTAMAWLRSAAKVMTAAKLPIWWTTPAGLPVLQTYRNHAKGEVRVYHKAKRFRVNVQLEAPGIDGKRQANAISPNVIHSFDAAHLMATANRCREQGIFDLAVVHDSFGVHACRAFDLSTILRETFVEQYSVDRLAMLRDELASQLPPEFVDLLPPLPARGDLDINVVRQSQYLFC